MANLAIRCIFFGVGMACLSSLLGFELFSKEFWLFVVGAACLWNSMPPHKDGD